MTEVESKLGTVHLTGKPFMELHSSAKHNREAAREFFASLMEIEIRWDEFSEEAGYKRFSQYCKAEHGVPASTFCMRKRRNLENSQRELLPRTRKDKMGQKLIEASRMLAEVAALATSTLSDGTPWEMASDPKYASYLEMLAKSTEELTRRIAQAREILEGRNKNANQED